MINNNNSDLRHEILTNELGNQMLDMVAPIYDNSKVALYLFQALGKTLEPEVEFIWNDFVAQIFPQTATWGLKYWEDEYGIVTDLSKSIEQRRAYFMSLKFDRPPMTPKRIESFVKGLTGFECEVVENVEPNTFHVIIRGYIRNLAPVMAELDKKTPAHLVYSIRVGDSIDVTVESYPVMAVGNIIEKIEGIEVLN